jgi:pectin methylesterase-like acyl-CoA thioesterase
VSAWFTQTTFRSVAGGAITANSREKQDDPGWFVFDSCNVVTSKEVSKTVYLGRPWRRLVRVMFRTLSWETRSIRRDGGKWRREQRRYSTSGRIRGRDPILRSAKIYEQGQWSG